MAYYRARQVNDNFKPTKLTDIRPKVFKKDEIAKSVIINAYKAIGTFEKGRSKKEQLKQYGVTISLSREFDKTILLSQRYDSLWAVLDKIYERMQFEIRMINSREYVKLSPSADAFIKQLGKNVLRLDCVCFFSSVFADQIQEMVGVALQSISQHDGVTANWSPLCANPESLESIINTTISDCKLSVTSPTPYRNLSPIQWLGQHHEIGTQDKKFARFSRY